jgi:hypothetical protein
MVKITQSNYASLPHTPAVWKFASGIHAILISSLAGSGLDSSVISVTCGSDIVTERMCAED